MLCYRCEHRAIALEGGVRARYECGVGDTSKYSCYMYQPCKPIMVERDDTDDVRPLSLNYFSARVHPSENQPELELNGKLIDGDKLIAYWQPVDKS